MQMKAAEQTKACNCLKMRRATHALTKIYNRFLEPSGLKIGQYSLLKAIRRMAPVNVSSLAAEMFLDRTTLVRNLKPLEEKGLVVDAAPAGTRNRQLGLTAEGRMAFENADVMWQEAQRYVESSIGDGNLQVLSSMLRKIEHLAD